MNEKTATPGMRAREIRKSLNLGLKEWARLLGSHVTTLHKWEKGSTPRFTSEHREILHNIGVNLFYIDFSEGDYFRPDYTIRKVKENIFARIGEKV